ncbi:PREDICTED: vesicle-trafficking protein SEC22b-A-like [Cyprinodon variegatus]|uniref:vesicle-trafficking protein SEC22b-A-like n=1 Tax=Cyprinodon variegatus TaxID=28743 RepID=UPI000742A14D|nr:PREDICTED: vesicle-trafficking protein SEC22b-A-like [Cyprinodon variegatus]
MNRFFSFTDRKPPQRTSGMRRHRLFPVGPHSEVHRPLPPQTAAAASQLDAAMIYLTMIARVADGLPLAASIQEDEQVSSRSASSCSSSRNLSCRSLSYSSSRSASSCSSSRNLSCRSLSYSSSRSASIPNLDTYIQKTKKSYVDSRARRNLSSINAELQDVQRIMVANMEDVLQRGEALSALDTKASNLSSLAKKYRSDAKFLNTRSAYAKVAAAALVFITFIIYVRFWWL